MKYTLCLLLGALLSAGNLHAQYCINNVGPSSTADSDIEDVILIGDNSAISNLASCPGVSGVDDYTATQSADVSLGTGYVLDITFGTCGGNYDGVGQAWIDWNQNGTFEASESVGTAQVPAGSMPVTATFSFSVPSSAPLGTTRMRVMQWEGGALPLNPCGSFIWGAVEDYAIVVTNTPPACPNTTFPSLASVLDVSAEIYWSGSGSSYNVEYGPAGYAQGTGTLINTANDSLLISGLVPNYSYDVYIQNDCSASGNGTSAWLGPLTFTTLCAATTAPYIENFDGLVVGNPVNCWELYAQSGFIPASALVSNAGTPVSSPNHLEYNNGFSGSTFLVSPLLAGLDSNQYQLEFWMASAGTPMNIQVGTQPAPWDTSGFIPLQTISSTGTYTLHTIYLNNIAPGQRHIVFKHDPSAFNASLFLDNIAYTSIPSCVPPQNLNFGALANSVDISYFFPGGSQVNYEWGPAGFTQGTGTFSTTGTNPFTISGLAPNTTYDIYVQGDCGANGTSPWAGPYSFTTPCITASLPYLKDFDSWPPSCFDMTGGSVQWLHFNNDYARGNYWSWTSGNQAYMTTEPIFIDQDAQVEYLWSHQYNSTYPDDQVIVRAQVVGSTVWDTISHLGGPSFNTPNSGPTTPGDFAAEIVYLNPAVYTNQNVRLQLIARSGFGPDVFLDDFEVNYVPACPEPLQLGAFQLQGFQANLNWNGGGPNWNVEYGPQGFGQGSGTLVSVSNDTTTLTGLVPSTCYDYYVQSDCGAGTTSTWNGPFTFCTTVSCPVPTGVSATASSNTASVVYTSGGASHVNYVIGATGTTPVTGTIMSSPGSGNLSIPGLNPQTGYDLWLRDSCGVGDVSSWVGPISIQTLCLAIPTPSLMDWSGVPAGQTGYIASNCWNLGSSLSSGQPGSIPRWETETGTGTNINSSNTGPHYDNTSFGQSGGIYIYMECSGGGQNDSAYVLSPEYDLSGLSNPQLSFFYHMYGATMGSLRVDVWNNGIWNNGLWSITGQQQSAGSDPWIKTSIPLTGYSGSIIVRFTGIRGSSFTGDMSLDDIRLDEIPACPEPSLAGVTNIGTTQADAFWTAGNSAATNWLIEYGPAGFTQGTGTSSIVANDTAAITGLLASTSYDYYVAEICSNGDTSLFVGPINFTTSICAANNRCPFVIDMFDSFGDGWNGNVLAIQQGGTTQGTFGQGFNTGSTFGPDTIYLCDNLQSQVVVSTLGSWTQEVGFTITDPNGSVVYTHTPGNTFSGGTVFTSFMSNCDTPSCASPVNPTVLSVDTSSATVYFTAGSTGANTWFIEYAPVGTPQGSGTLITVTNDTAVLPGLSPGIAYQFFVSELCPNGTDSSFFVGPETFAVPACQEQDKCPYTIDMIDSFGDGWNGNVLAFSQGSSTAGTFGAGFVTGSSYGPDTVYLCPNLPVQIVVHTLGSWTQEVGFTVNDPQGMAIFTHTPGNAFTANTVFNTFTPNCVPPACPNPTGLNAMPSTNSASLSWTEGSPGASTWIVDYGPTGYVQGSGTLGTTIVTNSNPFNLTGLNAASGYVYYVAELCPNGVDTSNYTGPFAFSTLCATVNVPFTVDFESLTSGSVGPSLANCWETSGSSSAPNWVAFESTGSNSNSFNTGPHYDHTFWGSPGGVYMYLECSGGSQGDTAGLVSVPVDLSGVSNPQLDFYYHMYGSNMGNLYVGMNSGSGWTYIDTLIGQQQNSGTDTFRLRTVPLSGATGVTRIKFIGERGSSFESDMSIDDVMITNGGSTNPGCATPTNFAQVASSCTSVDLDWTGTGNGSLLEYGPAGFTLGTGMTAFGTQPFTVAGLNPNTAYDFWVADTCGLTSDTSGFAGPLTLTTPNQPTPNITFSWIQSSTTLTEAMVDFDASSILGATGYYWNFGNGASDSNAVAMATYLQNGTYSVLLRVFNDCGSSDTIFDVTIGGISLLEQDLGNRIEVFPNPTNGQFRVLLESNRKRDFEFELIDMQGRRIRQQSVQNVQGKQEVLFDLTEFAQGVYLLRISSEGAHTLRSIQRN